MHPSHSVHGPESGWPVVLIHGFPFSRHQWDPQIAALRDTYRVIAIDMRGHGQSPAGDMPLMIEFLVDDLIALLDHHGVERATLCGLSMGGYVALRMVDRHPDRVHGLMLCDTRAEADSNEGRIKRAAAIRAIHEGGMSAFATTLLPALFSGEAIAANGEPVRKIRAQIEATDPRGACQALAAMACRLDLTERLPHIDTPALVVVGSEDTITPPADALNLAMAIPNAALVEIPGAGHVSNLSQPEAFNEAARAFLRKLG